ncbi:MAG: hypothetical protein AAFP85_00970 [Pseudomonadota bacterium]
MFRSLLAIVATFFLCNYPAAACTGPATTVVDEIYPSGDVVPENLLRMYLYFSGPMAEADILPHITLRNEDGAAVDGVFLSNRFDLWSPDRTRLTLLLDPGRVKTGLNAHKAFGRALVAGQSYVLTVDTQARTAAGCNLAAPFSHSFVAGDGDFDPPNPGRWALDLPAAGTTDPLRISLGSAHDHLSMAFRIQVRKDGQTLPGRVSLDRAETIWTFAPRLPWTANRHEVLIGEELEDLAGNRPGQLFDQPMDLNLPQPDLKLWFLPLDQ